MQAEGDEWNAGNNNNFWQSSTDNDWEGEEKKKDGNPDDDENTNDSLIWSTFEPSVTGDETPTTNTVALDEDMEAESWLDTLQLLAAEESEYNAKEADRADKARQMEEWGFTSETIANTLGVATDTTLEKADEVEGMQSYREESYVEVEDLLVVESHKTVEVDDETKEPIRTQMVYVDEHTCIGCTNCAMIAQSTFFMHSEHGRARVFQQWGDDDETIAIAIETCPVDCIHYVPYEELVSLEKDRRSQNINFKGRLVSQAENGNSLSHLTGGSKFTAPQEISGNMGTRCNNCPSRGCGDCPMYGVGSNPVFKKKEAERLAKREKRRLLALRKSEQKSAEF